MEQQRILPILEVTGTYYEMGIRIGETFQERITDTLSRLNTFVKQQKWDQRDPGPIDFILKQSQKLFPDYIDHLRGIADGSGVPFRDLAIHNFMHIPAIANCSTGIIINPDMTCICHNEDAHPLLGANSYFVQYNFGEPLKLLAHCYPGVLPGMSFGVNSHGIFMSTNALPDPYRQMGVSRVFHGFHALHQPTIEKAAEVVQNSSPRMGGVNYNFLSYAEKKVLNIETSSITARTTEVTKNFFHTNHYLHEDLKLHPAGGKDSISRQVHGEWHIKSSELTPQTLMEAMQSKGIFLSLDETEGEYQTNGILLVTTESDLILTYYPRDEPETNNQVFKLSDI